MSTEFRRKKNPGNTRMRGVGFSESLLNERKSRCGARLRGQWGFSIWTQSDFVVIPDGAGRLATSPEGTWHLARSVRRVCRDHSLRLAVVHGGSSMRYSL